MPVLVQADGTPMIRVRQVVIAGQKAHKRRLDAK
jgi:hypothetical protein